MKMIRQCVFETNSSSTHSFSISKDSSGILETLPVSPEGIVTLNGGEFNWKWEIFTDALTKANYAAVYARDISMSGNYDYFAMLTEVINKHTGSKQVVFNLDNSHIDHQSAYGENGLPDFFDSKRKLKNWIFNPKSVLRTGNDNDYEPFNFFDSLDTKYTYEISFNDQKQLFTEKPSNEDIMDFLAQAAESKIISDFEDPGELPLRSSFEEYIEFERKSRLYHNSKYKTDYYEFKKSNLKDSESFKEIDSGFVILFQQEDYDKPLTSPKKFPFILKKI